MRLALTLTKGQRLEADQRTYWALRDHQLGEAMGGTSIGSTVACSCGDRLYVDGTRGQAMQLALSHVAEKVLQSLTMTAKQWDTRHAERWLTRKPNPAPPPRRRALRPPGVDPYDLAGSA